MEGQVVNTSDPDQMGRVKVWVPALDGDSFDVAALPWTEYASPLFGFTVDLPAGAGTSTNNGHNSYGIWAIPKMGATVLVFCLNGDPLRRFYFASTVRLHRNRSLPAGRNSDELGNLGPTGDAGDGSGKLNVVEPAWSNLREQFQNKVGASQAVTRGAWERQVAQPGKNKDGLDGYAKTPLAGESYLDPQTYCWVTPGHHAIIMQDDPKSARFRIKTAEGSQVILDDANERIYVSTAKGKTWIELDQDGHVHIYGSQSISMRAGEDINFYADKNFNVEAGQAINMKAIKGDISLTTGASLNLSATKDALISACAAFGVTAKTSLSLTSDSKFDVKASGPAKITGTGVDVSGGQSIKMTAGKIDLNGPEAQKAEAAKEPCQADSPPIIPAHEPWSRPATKGKRGPNWKE